MLRLETWRTEKAPDTEVRGQERSRAQQEREREREREGPLLLLDVVGNF